MVSLPHLPRPVHGVRYRHKDAHLGQLGAQCAACHSVAARPSQVTLRLLRAEFQLTGKHDDHRVHHLPQNRDRESFRPAGHRDSSSRARGRRATRTSTSASSATTARECHRTDTFKLTSHEHRGDPDFFKGGHADGRVPGLPPHDRGRLPGRSRRGDPVHQPRPPVRHLSRRRPQGDARRRLRVCHTVHAPFRDPSRAFHKSTMLPLEGRHLQVPCADCHWDGQIKGTDRCYDCPGSGARTTANRLGNECEQCPGGRGGGEARGRRGARGRQEKR